MQSLIDLLNKRVEVVSHLRRRKRSYKSAYAKREKNSFNPIKLNYMGHTIDY